MDRPLARWLKLSLAFAATAGFGWLLVRGLDADALAAAFAGLSPAAIALALVFLVAGWSLRILRWWWMLRALEPSVPLGACAGPFLAGMAVNNVVPFRAGDAFRTLGYLRQLRVPAMGVAGTMVVERILDIAVLTGVFFLCLSGLPEGAFERGFATAAAWLAGVVVAAVLALPALWPWLARRGASLARSRPLAGRRWVLAAGRHGAHLGAALRLMRSSRRMPPLVGLSVVAWACEGAFYAAVAAALGGDAFAPGPWFSLATGTLATVIPSAPGHIGTFDFFAAQGFAAWGASPERAVAFALSVHAVLWVSSTLAGLPFVFLRRRRAAAAAE